MASGTTTVGKIQYIVEVDTNGLVTGINQAESIVKKSGFNKESIFDGFKNAASSSFNFVKKAAAVSVAAIGVTIGAGLDAAIKRSDTLNNFPNVMRNFGISTDLADKSIKKISESLKGLPTALDTGALAVQRLTSRNGDVEKSTDIFLALNNAVLAGGAPMDLQATAMEQLTQAYAKGKPDMVEWRAAMTAMPAQLKQVATAMGFINPDEFGSALREGTVSMDDFIDTIVKLNTEGIDGFDNFDTQARNATGGISTSIANAKTAVIRGIQGMIEAIGAENIKAAAEGLGRAFEGIGNAIAAVINFFKENQWAWEVLKAILIVLTIVIVALTVAQIALNIAAMINPFTLIVMAVVALIAAIVLLISNFGAVLDFFKMIGEWIYNNVIKPIGDFFAGLFEGITNGIKAIGDFFVSIFTNVVNFVGGIAEKIVGFFAGIGKKIGDFIAAGFKAVVNGALGLLEGFLNMPINLINGAIGLINLIPGVNIPNIPNLQLPRMATGGIVPSDGGGRLIFAGEGGEDEWIVPESKMASLMDKINGAGGGGITINLSGVFATSPADQRRVAEQIVDQIEIIRRTRMGAGATS